MNEYSPKEDYSKYKYLDQIFAPFPSDTSFSIEYLANLLAHQVVDMVSTSAVTKTEFGMILEVPFESRAERFEEIVEESKHWILNNIGDEGQAIFGSSKDGGVRRWWQRNIFPSSTISMINIKTEQEIQIGRQADVSK